MPHKWLGSAQLAKIPTQKTGPWHWRREPSLETKAGGEGGLRREPLHLSPRRAPHPEPLGAPGAEEGHMNTWCGTKKCKGELTPAKGELNRTGGHSLRAWDGS